eukprot:10244950-Heterocapsa_arctica.AAC.1
MSFRAAVNKGLSQRTIDVFPRCGVSPWPLWSCGVSPWPLWSYSLDGLGLGAIRYRNSLVRAYRRPALER